MKRANLEVNKFDRKNVTKVILTAIAHLILKTVKFARAIFNLMRDTKQQSKKSTGIWKILENQ